jgi:hypothetical protein
MGRTSRTLRGKGGKDFVVLDGAQGTPYYGVNHLCLSPVGGRVASTARRVKDGKPFVVCDGKEAQEYDAIREGTLNFGLDGRSLSYVAERGKDEQFLVIDGKEQARFNKVLPNVHDKLFLGRDAIGYVAVRDGAYYWVEHSRRK